MTNKNGESLPLKIQPMYVLFDEFFCVCLQSKIRNVDNAHKTTCVKLGSKSG